jgi:nicotinate phosphoribosyltransferase
MKLSPGKISAPGPKQVFRGPPTEGDIAGVQDEPVPAGHEPRLMPVMLGGQPTGANGDLAAARVRFDDELGRRPATAHVLQDAQ